MALTAFLSFGVVLRAGFAVLIGAVITFLFSFYKHRSRMIGVPKPPWTPILGNLKIMGELVASLPPGIHPHTYVHYLQEKYNLPDIFYIDSWPFGDQILAIVHPDVATSVTVQHSLPKHASLNRAIWPITGYKSLVALEGKEHKTWRAVFNPGFASGHLMTLVPGIVDDCVIFMNQLSRYAKSREIFQLEGAATKVTIDIIGRVVLDTQMHAQTSENGFVTAFRNQLTWLPDQAEINPLKKINPLRPFMIKYNEWRMDKYLMNIMSQRWTARSEPGSIEQRKKRGRPIIDLALNSYQESGEVVKGHLDRTKFQKSALQHIKVFMFGGHDTTSSTICWVAYALSQYPDCLRRFRHECDEVFGPDPSQTMQKIKDQPHLINELQYSAAIIKETLRLWPAASSVRRGEAGFFLHHQGKQYQTYEDMITWPVAHALHTSPKLWPESTKFIPERWLVKEGDPLYPIKGAWRPFEFGNRSCIGQELAVIETKIIMALMLRTFTIETAYEELDKAAGRKADEMITPEGDRAYQVLIATAKPVDGMPCRIYRR